MRSIEGDEAGAAGEESFEGVGCTDGVKCEMVSMGCMLAGGRRRVG